MTSELKISEHSDFSLPVQIILLIIAIISSFISLLVPALYFIRKKCQQHPTSLIAIISLLQALSNYNVILIALNIYAFEEFIDISEIFHLFVFYDRDRPQPKTFCQFNFIGYILLQMMSIAYNVSFSFDLLLTLKWPFLAGKKRMKYYHFFSFLFCLIAAPLSVLQAEEICTNQYHLSIYRIPRAFFIALLSFYFISFLIIIYSFITPQNSQIRRKYIRHHRIILIVLLVVWAFPIATNILIYHQLQQTETFKILNIASFISLLISGGLISIVRFINDSFVWIQVKKMILQWKYFQESVPNIDPDLQENSFIAVNKKKKQEYDVWNLPLANAVSSVHSQSVVTNIIQIIVQTCQENDEIVLSSNFAKSSLLKSSRQEDRASFISSCNKNNQIKFQNYNYEFNGPPLNPKQIREYLKYGTYQQFKRISRINKKFDMISVELKNQDKDKDFEKNVFKSIDYYSSYSGSQISSIKSKKYLTNQLDLSFNKIKINVKSYSHFMFTALRKVDGLPADIINKTLDIALNQQNIKKARESLGASGSFFFFSHDHKLVIKTISQSQTNLFIKILPSYYDHIIKNPNSLLCRTYGLYSVQIDGISKIHFIMLQNTFSHFESSKLKYRKYDLKGSTIKRQVKNPNAQVLKDINFLNSDDAFILLPHSIKNQLFHQIKADITLLSNHNIMDYSLLIGINIENAQKALIKRLSSLIKSKQLQQINIRWRYFSDSELLPINKIYSISIIDYLQQFNFNKYAELYLKKIFRGGGDISSIDTEAYFRRFLAFVNRILVPVS